MASDTSTPRLPDFLILGAAKAGTTALYLYLSQHPGLFASPLRETNFFALEGTTPSFSGPGDDAAVNRRAVTRWEAYLKLFAGAKPGQRAGECSPLYLYHPDAAARIAERLPEARLVVLLRNPAERAYASYLHLVRDGREPASTFEEGLAREAERIAAGWEHLWHYRAMGLYGEQLARYVDRFDPDRIKLIRYEDFCRDPGRAVSAVAAFLGLDAGFSPDLSRRPNRSGVPRMRGLYRLLASPPLRRVARAIVPAGMRGKLGAAMDDALLVRPPMAPATRAALLDGYREDAARLTRCTGVDVSDWFSSPSEAS
ncbi:MAG: sulfotransferase [Rhodothermales bacterium]